MSAVVFGVVAPFAIALCHDGLCTTRKAHQVTMVLGLSRNAQECVFMCVLDFAQIWRRRAEECRMKAGSFRNIDTRDRMLQLAANYDRMALKAAFDREFADTDIQALPHLTRRATDRSWLQSWWDFMAARSNLVSRLLRCRVTVVDLQTINQGETKLGS